MPLATKAHPPLRPSNVNPGAPKIWILTKMSYIPKVIRVLQPPTEEASPFPPMPGAQEARRSNPEQNQSETTDEEHDTNEEPMPKKQRKN